MSLHNTFLFLENVLVRCYLVLLKAFQFYIIIKMPFPLGWANSDTSYARISYSVTSAPFFNFSSDVQ